MKKSTSVQYKDYVAGWLDSTISTFLESFQDVPGDMAFALVTCLDSNLHPASLLKTSPELRSVARLATILNEAILLPTDVLLDANSKDPLFFGFDEVWFFPDESIGPKPDSAWLVGPNRMNQMKIRKLGQWMSENRCSVAMGDGGGLNVIVKTSGMARHLIGHSLAQPQASMIAAE